MVEKDTLIDLLKREAEKKAAELKARQDAAPFPPSVRSLCLDHTLDEAIQLNPERDEKFLHSLKFDTQQFDAHCVYCGQDATFRTLTDREPDDVALAVRRRGLDSGKDLKRLRLESGQFALHLRCLRRPNHLYSYFFAIVSHGVV